jgi:hypothetical protein
VLRGYLFGALILHGIFTARGKAQWLPLRDSSALVWALVMVVCVVLSVRLGLATPRLKAGLRAAVAVGAVGLLAFAVAEVNRAFYLPEPTMTAEVTATGITDIYPYDEAGRPLTGVRLYDQNGTRLTLGDPWRCVKPQAFTPTDPPFRGAIDYRWAEPEFRYPLCPPDGWQPTPITTPGPTAGPSAPAPQPSPTR